MGQITSTYHLHTCVNFFKDILEESKSDLASVTYIILTLAGVTDSYCTSDIAPRSFLNRYMCHKSLGKVL